VGWAFGNGWRVEGEFVYQSVDAGNPGFAAPGPQGNGDNFASTSAALNLLYDIDLFGSEKAKTYLGLGYGPVHGNRRRQRLLTAAMATASRSCSGRATSLASACSWTQACAGRMPAG
jgi:hypothetical protein